ncbi:MAG: hypothetical protein EA001_12230 [Oscillatoriales cyanobacterium]|nr:MAG: hypothetical protein EA001_12230 [Oscillatoriales cyanobacterium]
MSSLPGVRLNQLTFLDPATVDKGLRACHQMPLMADETVMFRAPVVVTRGLSPLPPTIPSRWNQDFKRFDNRS